MEISYIIPQRKKNRRGNRSIPWLIWLIVASGCLDHAFAQNRSNQSDWNVPPPLTPGTITKGNSPAGKPVVLTLTDIPAVSQPFVSATQIPLLAAIGSTPPAVDAPDQPNIIGKDAGLPEIPSPEAPETPRLPKQTMQDLQFSAVMDLPVPESPELPPSSVEPTASGKINMIKGPLPVMPDVMGAIPLLQPPGDLVPWSIPQMPDNACFKLAIPTGAKDEKAKGKSQSNRKK